MNEREITIWNRVLLALVIILLGLAIIILLKIAFFPFNFDVKDWGTRSDLLSSISTAIAALGTLGTLIIAGMAYRKAPHWINQKKHESAYDLAKELLLTDYSHMSEKMNLAFNYCEMYRDIGFNSLDEFNSTFTSDDCLKMVDDFDLIKVNTQQLILKIETLRKMGWVMKSDVLESIKKIHNSFNFASMTYRSAWLKIDTFVSGLRIEDNEKQLAFLNKSFDRPSKHINDFFTEYSKLKKYSDEIEPYFIIKK